MELCDLHDKSYMRQAVMDNHLNGRTRDLIRTVKGAREKMDIILAKEKKKDQEFADLKAKCEEAMEEIEKNPLVQDLRADIQGLEKKLKDARSECKRLRLEEAKMGEYKEEIATLESKCEGLESERTKLKEKEIKLREELDGLKRQHKALKKVRAAVVSKVVPYIAMELYHSDEVGKVIAGLVNAVIYHGKCTTLEEIATTGKPVDLSKVPYYRSTHEREYENASNALAAAEYPFLREATKDPTTSVDALLANRPRKEQPPSSSKMSTPAKPPSVKTTSEKPPCPFNKESMMQPPSPGDKTNVEELSSPAKASPEKPLSPVTQGSPKSPCEE
jgi:outer membrane murein-binding lipoprotein Lpp